MTALVVIEGIVILLLAILVAGLLRSHGEILRRLEALGAGEALEVPMTRPPGGIEPVSAGSITGVTPDGTAAGVTLTESRGYTLLAFLSSGCTACRPFWEGLTRGVELPRTDIRPVVVTRGADRESPAEIASLAPENVTTLMSSDAWDAFRVPGSPYFQLVDAENGTVLGEGSASSWSRLFDLIRRAIAEPEPGLADLGRTTRERLRDTDEELIRAGIEPGDSTLYANPDPPTEPPAGFPEEQP